MFDAIYLSHCCVLRCKMFTQWTMGAEEESAATFRLRGGRESRGLVFGDHDGDQRSEDSDQRSVRWPHG